MSAEGHVQSLLSGHKRINILLNPECWQGRAKAAAQYSPPCLPLLCGSTILELSFFLASFGVREGGGARRGMQENESGLAFDVLIGRRVRTAAALRALPMGEQA